jgi:hypothetical protein
MDILDACLADVFPLIDAARIERGIVELARLERNTDFDSFARSATYLCERFRAIGVESEVLHFPADGRTKYHCWTSPIGFRTTRATCEIVEAKDCALVRSSDLSRLPRVLGDRAAEPNTAIVGSGHTGPQGIEAKVVHIEDPADVAQTDMRGKIVYCSRFNPFSIRRAVVEGGGLAVVSSFTEDRAGNYRYVKWINTWDAETDGWLPTARGAQENLPGISISPEMGDCLEGCLARGPVKLRVVTEGAYFASELPGVLALSPGQDERFVLLTGHLFEQGFADNAAGVGVALAVSEILQALKEQSGIGAFRRGWGHFHGQECYGVLALHQYHPQIVARAFAHLTLDQLGLAGLPLRLRPGLLASAGLSDFPLRMVLKRARALMPACGYEVERAFEINCTLLADPALGGVPSALFTQENPAWHTSRDRVGAQELDHDALTFATLAAAAWAYFVVTAGDAEAEWLLAEYKKDVEATLRDGKVPDTQIYLDLKQREMSGVAHLVSPGRKEALREEVCGFIAGVRARIGEETAIVPAGTGEEVERSRQTFPKAILGGTAVDGCFTPEQLQVIGSPRWDRVQLVLKSWADGSRSVYDITRLTIFETGARLSLDYTLAFFEQYARQGIVSLQPGEVTA